MKFSSSLFLATAGAFVAFQQADADIVASVGYDEETKQSTNNKCAGLQNDALSGSFGYDTYAYGFKMDGGCTSGTYLLKNLPISGGQEGEINTCSTLSLAAAENLEVTIACNAEGTAAKVAFTTATIDVDVGAKVSTTGTLYDVLPAGSGDTFLFASGNDCIPGSPDNNLKCQGISHLNFCIPCPDPEPSVTDDPHFLTWNNTYYDFMGACDLKLITAPFFAPDLVLDIDIRTTIRYQYSYIESAVVKIGENTLEVTSFGGYMLDGVSSANLPSTLAGFAVKHSQPSKHVHLFEIILSDEEKILVKTFKDMVSVKLSGAKSERFHGSQGMLGSYDNHGLMLARDGATILEDGDAFAAEWQIRDSEPMVFQTVRAPQFPEACQLPTMTQEESRRRLAESSITMEAAEEACASWPKETISGCIHDVLATGDLELAAAGAF